MCLRLLLVARPPHCAATAKSQAPPPLHGINPSTEFWETPNNDKGEKKGEQCFVRASAGHPIEITAVKDGKGLDMDSLEAAVVFEVGGLSGVGGGDLIGRRAQHEQGRAVCVGEWPGLNMNSRGAAVVFEVRAMGHILQGRAAGPCMAPQQLWARVALGTGPLAPLREAECHGRRV